MSSDEWRTRDKSNLHVVTSGELPTSLREYAGDSPLIGASLRAKLGMNAYWLAADCIYGLRQAGAEESDMLDTSNRIVLPVRYVGLRKIDRHDILRFPESEPISQLTHEDRVAIFSLRQDIVRRSSMLTAHGFTLYAEIGVDLYDPVTLLDENEYKIPISHRV